jgi:hypothetical protein
VTSRQTITDALALIFRGIDQLNAAFPHRAFTIDGRLVGDIGEVIASLEYDVSLDSVSQASHDGVTSDGRRVQVKATFKGHLTCRSVPDYYLGFQLYRDGRHDEVFNGPGRLIKERFGHRAGFGESLLSFPVAELRRLSATVAEHERIARRKS